MTLAGVAAGSQAVSKANLGGSDDGFLEGAALPFKMVWALFLSPTARGVPTVVAGAPCPGEPYLQAPDTPAASNCSSLTHTHTTHITHSYPLPHLYPFSCHLQILQ